MPAGELAGFSSALIHSAKRIGRDSLRLQRAATYHLLPASHLVKSCFTRLPPYNPSPPIPRAGHSATGMERIVLFVKLTTHHTTRGPRGSGQAGPKASSTQWPGWKDRSSEHRNSGLTPATFHLVVKTKHHFLFSKLGEIILPLKEETLAKHTFYGILTFVWL